jgi:hypothetical protein
MKVLRPLFALVATLSLGLIGTGTVSASSSSALTCSGTFTAPGFIAPGTYSSIKVVGLCLGPLAGNVIVQGDVTVAKGAALLANYPANPIVPEGDANFFVKGNVVVRDRGTLLLGCDPSNGCVNTTFDTVKGNVDAEGALGVIVHSALIGGNLSFVGGGGGVTCTPSGVFALIGSPDYSNAENNAIGGSFTVTDLRSCWFGEFRNIILGNNTVTGNTFDISNPFGSDATEVANNVVFGTLACFGNVPDAQFGDSAQPPNVVFGAIRGECKPLSIH